MKKKMWKMQLIFFSWNMKQNKKISRLEVQNDFFSCKRLAWMKLKRGEMVESENEE